MLSNDMSSHPADQEPKRAKKLARKIKSKKTQKKQTTETKNHQRCSNTSRLAIQPKDWNDMTCSKWSPRHPSTEPRSRPGRHGRTCGLAMCELEKCLMLVFVDLLVGQELVASLLLVVMPGATSNFLLLEYLIVFVDLCWSLWCL